MPFVNQWVFSVDTDGVKLKNNNTGDIYVLVKNFLMFKELDPQHFILYEESTQITLTINMNECLTPPPAANIEAFLDSLATLISA